MIILKIALLVMLVLPFIFLCLRLFALVSESHRKEVTKFREIHKKQRKESLRERGQNNYEKRNIRNNRRP